MPFSRVNFACISWEAWAEGSTTISESRYIAARSLQRFTAKMPSLMIHSTTTIMPRRRIAINIAPGPYTYIFAMSFIVYFAAISSAYADEQPPSFPMCLKPRLLHAPYILRHRRGFHINFLSKCHALFDICHNMPPTFRHFFAYIAAITSPKHIGLI